MGKKSKSNSVNAAYTMESKVSPILEIKYKEPLFAVAAHPTKPILAQGLATGHVFCTSYDAEKLEQQQQERREQIIKEEMENFKKGTVSQVVKSVSQLKKKWWSIIEDYDDVPQDSHVVTMWKTRRHKGSCRSIIFDPLENSLGENIYSVGTDHIIKKANTETGKVIGKTDTSKDYPEEKDAITRLCHSATNPFLLAGTENGHVLVYDSSNLSKAELKFKVPNAHEDSINQIIPLSSRSSYRYLTLGSTTLSHIDIRKGVVSQSDDQEDELLSMCYSSDNITDNKNDTVLVSHGEGIVTIWKDSKNGWRDQLSRIKVNKGVSIDAIVPTMSCETEEMANSVWCGDGDGLLHRINHKLGKVVETRVHSSATGKYGALDEVGGLEIDYNYRLISSGMDLLKIWSEQSQEDIIESDVESESSDDSNESDDDSGIDSDSLSDSDEGSDLLGEEVDSDDEKEDGEDLDQEQVNEKKRPGSTSDESDEELTATKKPKNPKQLTTKQLRNMQKHEHGIRRFEDL